MDAIDSTKQCVPALSRRSLVALGLASTAGMLVVEKARASILDYVPEGDANGAEPADEPASGSTLPESVWLWTSRTLCDNDGASYVTMRRAYDERGNIIEHSTIREDGAYTIGYVYEDGLPVARFSSYDGSEPTEQSGFEADFDDEGFPTVITWFSDDVSTVLFHETGYVASEVEMDTTGDAPSPACFLYDEDGYPLAAFLDYDHSYRTAAWQFDERGHAAGLSLNETIGVYLYADDLQEVRQDLDSYDFADLLERFFPEEQDREDLEPFEGHAFELMDTADGGAVAFDVDGWQSLGDYTCETDEEGNILVVYNEQGLPRYKATYELIEDPTAWAMYMSGYRFLITTL